MARKRPDKAFKDWTYEEVGDAFGVKRVFQHPLFDYIAALKLPTNHLKQ